MSTRLAELEPKIREFQGAVDSIESDFLTQLDKLLTGEQRKKLASMRAAEGPETQAAGPLPAPPFQFGEQGFIPPPPPPMQAPNGQPLVLTVHTPFPAGGWLMMSMIIYQPSFDHLVAELKLDPSQQTAVKQLMLERRTRLLALIDKSPPPSLDLGQALP
ncbi:MAG TPA: hypothetical protein VGH29_17410 [Candidatus Binataceae bacterium]